MIRMHPLLLVLALSATAPAAVAAPTLHPLPARLSDEVIASDLAAIDGAGARLDSLAKAGPVDPWRAAAAREWLTAARTEYTDRDRTGFDSGAFGRAVALIDEIAAHADTVTHASVPAWTDVKGTVQVTPEMQAALESLKRHEGFPCAREEIARMEVQLAWAGNEQVDQGDCMSSPHLALARQLARDAQVKEEACIAVAPVVAERPTPIEPPKPQVPTREELKIPRNVHFALDKSFISPDSRKVIEGVAALLQKYPSIRVRLVGHTDSRASAAYNLALSQRRVDAAEKVFRELGISPDRMSTDFKGKEELTAEEKDTRGFALNRRVEMVFVDPDGRDIKSEAQEGDLQLEKSKPAAPAVKHPVRKPLAKPAGAKRPVAKKK